MDYVGGLASRKRNYSTCLLDAEKGAQSLHRKAQGSTELVIIPIPSGEYQDFNPEQGETFAAGGDSGLAP